MIQSQTRRGDVSLVDFVYLVFTRMPSDSFRRSLFICWCDIFRALINSLNCLLNQTDGTTKQKER